MLPIVFRQEAAEELGEVYIWYEEKRTGLGEDFLKAFLDQVTEIQRHPERWAVLYRKVRACPMARFPYIIYYRKQPEELQVIAIQHGHRDPKVWRRRA